MTVDQGCCVSYYFQSILVDYHLHFGFIFFSATRRDLSLRMLTGDLLLSALERFLSYPVLHVQTSCREGGELFGFRLLHLRGADLQQWYKASAGGATPSCLPYCR